MQLGTNYFVSLAAAVAYYADYHFEDAAVTVECKLKAGEIRIGEPRIKPGERLVKIDSGRRWAIIW